MRILASLTAADPLAVGEAARRLQQAGVDGLHVDIGDGRFVPWLGGSLELVAALVGSQGLAVAVHLMVEDPERWLRPLAEAGAGRVAVHLEAERYPWRLRTEALRHGLFFGLALNPATPVGALEPLPGCADFVSLLTTEPDADGERFLPGMLEKIAAARQLLGPRVEIEVDGGLDAEWLQRCAAAGADVAVVGRELTRAENATVALRRLTAAGLGGVA